MHFQVPPSAHVKLVYCVLGEVEDVVLDLRMGSPTYGMAESINLSSDVGNCVYIPAGFAHGFYVRSDLATLVYKVTTVHDPVNDSGILWSSFNHDWPNSAPLISSRDSGLLAFTEFQSPFIYDR
jgi:dTDP-4-dehydrorhamnose 3,5-epimerase